MKNYQIEFILKIKEGNSYKLQQQIISIDSLSKKEAIIEAKKKLYIPRNFMKIDFYEFI